MDITESTTPQGAKARHVYMSLREDITNGIYAVNSCLPGEQRLAATYAVSRVTVRRALDALCAEGWLERHAGSGTVVCRAPSPCPPVAMNFSTLLPQLAEMSRSTTARLLSFTYAEAPPHVAEAMGLENSSHVQIASRVRFTNGLPFSHLTTYVPESIACNYSEHDLATTPLYELLERGGVTIDNAHQSVSATLASPTVAKALNIAVGTALLSINRVVRDSEGCAVEYLSARYRPDLFRLDMDLTRVNEGASRQWQPVIHAANNPLPSNADSVVDSENSGSGVSAQQGSRESA